MLFGLSRQDEWLTQTRPSGAADQPAAPDDNPSDLIYSTYIGGTSSNYGQAIAVDDAGNAYMTGCTGSSNFPTTAGAMDRAATEARRFLAKLNPSGSGLVYATYLGGGGDDRPRHRRGQRAATPT